MCAFAKSMLICCKSQSIIYYMKVALERNHINILKLFIASVQSNFMFKTYVHTYIMHLTQKIWKNYDGDD